MRLMSVMATIATRLEQALRQVPGAAIMQGKGSYAWLYAGTVNTRGSAVSTEDALRGARAACYSNVYLDGVLVYDGAVPGEPLFNLASMAVDQIEAMEYYRSPAETPAIYSKRTATCGVLVVWTRR